MLCEMVCFVVGVFDCMCEIVEGLYVDVVCMCVNFDFMYGLIFGEVVMLVLGVDIGCL